MQVPAHHAGASSDEADADDSLEDELIPWQSMTTPCTAGGNHRALPGKAHAAVQDPADSRNSAAEQRSSGAATGAAAQGSVAAFNARTRGGGAQPRKLSRLAPAADVQNTDDDAVSPGECRTSNATKLHVARSTSLVAGAGNPFVSASRTAHMQARIRTQELQRRVTSSHPDPF